MTASIATRMLTAHRESESAEHAFYLVVASIMGATDYSYTVDDYDGSIEIYAPGIDVAALGRAVMALGFDRCWVHPHVEGECARPRCESSTMFRYVDGELVAVPRDGAP